MADHGVVRDRDGDIWVEVEPGQWQCATDGTMMRAGQMRPIDWVEETYGPLEYPRWVQHVKVPEDGPAGPEHDHCRPPCDQAGKWGAGAGMPPGHHWHWRNAEHTSGYLAHG